MGNQEKYRHFCSKNDSLHLFQQAWWYDAVCGPGGWSASIVENNSEIIGALAYPLKKKYGHTLIAMPLLMPFIEPYIQYFPGQKYASQVSHEQQLMDELIKQFPPFHFFDLYMLSGIKSHLPFHWSGFKQSTRYTYIIDSIKDLDKTFNNFNSSIRSQIRKAEQNMKIEESGDVELFYKINALSYKRQQKKAPYSLIYVKKIIEACKKHQAGSILLAKDSDENVHAALFLTYDSHSAYYMMGGSDEQYKNSGAYSLLMWESIKRASLYGGQYNFCGSMIPSVERFFRSFGGTQVPYWQIKKTHSKLLQLYFASKK